MRSCKEEASQVSLIGLVIFNKAELMELGACVGIELVKHDKLLNISEACDEVVEDKLNPLGMLSLSKKEAIQIGQCFGVIKYIYDYYDDAKYQAPYYSSYRRSDNVYQCEKGMRAVSILRASEQKFSSRADIRDVLCR